MLDALINALIPPAHADSAAMTAVGVDLTPLPEGIPPIRMERELVEISLYPLFVVVEAEFELFNRGPAMSIEVGFPCLLSEAARVPYSSPLLDFSVEVDGVACPCDRREFENETFPWWHVWTQDFGESATTLLKVRYWTPLLNYAGVSVAPFIYVLRTGRFWEGTIGQAVIRVRGADAPVSSIVDAYPPNWRVIDDDTIEWEFTDLDPQEDIQLLISPLSIAADYLGFEFTPVVELNRDRPPEGTEVTVGGYFRDLDDAEGDSLNCERARDRNIVVPDCLPSFDERGSAILRLDKRGATEEILMVPDLADDVRSWIPSLVCGTVAYDGDELILRASRVMMVKPACKPRFAPDLLPWATDRGWERRFPGKIRTAPWPRFVERPSMAWSDDSHRVKVEDWLKQRDARKMPRREASRERLVPIPESKLKPPPIRPRKPKTMPPPIRPSIEEETPSEPVGESLPVRDFSLVPARLGKSRILRRLWPLSIARVVGNSSFPDLVPGDVLFAWKWHGPLEVGDLVLIGVGGKTLVKLISNLDSGTVRLRGNAHWGTVPRSQVIARVFFVKRRRVVTRAVGPSGKQA